MLDLIWHVVGTAVYTPSSCIRRIRCLQIQGVVIAVGVAVGTYHQIRQGIPLAYMGVQHGHAA